MKFRCAVAVAAMALSSLGCQAVKQKSSVQDSQVLPVSHLQQSQRQQVQRGVTPALRPVGYACDSCGEACGPCCGADGCGGAGCCSSGNARINSIVSGVLDCNAHDGYYGFQPGPPVGQTAYPYYTVRGPRDFLATNPRSIGPTGAYGCR